MLQSCHTLRRYCKTKYQMVNLLMDMAGVVKLAHLSVKEYLVSGRILKGIASSFSISAKVSHTLIAQTCLAYLLQFDTPNCINTNTIQSFPLALYAGEHWIFHMQSGDNKNLEAVQKMILKLLEPFGSPLINWIRLWDPDAAFWEEHTNLGLTNVAMPLYYASLSGLAEASQQMLANGADVNAQGGRYGNALQAALAGG